MAEPAVLLAGGGTAGHVNPLLAVADALRAARPGIALVALGTAEGLEARLVPEHGIELVAVPRVPLPRRPTLDWLRLPARLRAAVRAAGTAIDTSGAQVVVGFGGYVATPAYLAARRRRVPVVVHEQNARPGLANRLGARWASAVAVTFPATRLPHAQVTGLPLRASVARLVDDRAADPVATRTRAAIELGVDPALPTLLVTGGSLGALSLNRAVAGAAADLLAAGVQVVHLTGKGKADPVRAALAGVPGAQRYHVLEYLDRMDRALAVADLVLCRAGAGTVCELTALEQYLRTRTRPSPLSPRIASPSTRRSSPECAALSRFSGGGAYHARMTEPREIPIRLGLAFRHALRRPGPPHRP